MAPYSKSELTTCIGTELESRFGWPSALLPLTKPLHNLGAAMDLGKLAGLAERVHRDHELAFTIISKEYIETGVNWIYAMRTIGLANFLVVAGDEIAARELEALHVPNVLAEINERDFDASFLSVTGFSAKGLAVSAFKFPVAHFLLQSGYSVILSDADAIWLHDPMPCLRSADLSFQRIAYHPPPISRLWGFAACSGFLSLRNTTAALVFAERCLEAGQRFFSDQVALNYALLEGEPEWRCVNTEWLPPASGTEPERRCVEAAFAKWAKYPITGKLRNGGLEVLALPHDKFWRHEIVTSALADMLICHPNSPKNDQEKMKIFDAMGLRFTPPAIGR